LRSSARVFACSLAAAFGLLAALSSVRSSAAGPDASTNADGAIAQAAAPSSTGLVTIESDRQQADNQTGIVTATGNVRITYPDKGMVATSRQAQYFSKEGQLILTGDVDVIDADGQSIQAEKLTYQLDSERLLAEPPDGQQVRSRLRIQPSTDGSSDAQIPPSAP